MADKDTRKLWVSNKLNHERSTHEHLIYDYEVTKAVDVVMWEGTQIYIGIILPRETVEAMIAAGVSVTIEPWKV